MGTLPRRKTIVRSRKTLTKRRNGSKQEKSNSSANIVMLRTPVGVQGNIPGLVSSAVVTVPNVESFRRVPGLREDDTLGVLVLELDTLISVSVAKLYHLALVFAGGIIVHCDRSRIDWGQDGQKRHCLRLMSASRRSYGNREYLQDC